MNLQSLNALVATGFEWTWKTSLSATVLIALVWLVQPGCRRLLAARWCYALGLLILVRLALPVVPSSSFSILNLGTFIAPSPKPQPAPAITASAFPAGMLPVRGEPITPVRKRAPFPFIAYAWLAGCSGMLLRVARQQRNLALQLKNENVLTDPRLLAQLEECKRLLRLNRPVRLLVTQALSTPALFGVRRPQLLIPESMLYRLNQRELRLIMLHELTHLKQGDLVVNWAVIVLRAAHWFNPLVWLALRRLRADQELACDAAVMRRLASEDRRLYGDTLLKFIAEFSPAALCPAVVPFITSKQLIKRRIIMIANFKPAGRSAAVVSLTLLIALGGTTFTRARLAEPPAPKPLNALQITNSAQLQAIMAGIQSFQAVEVKLNAQVRAKENEVEKIRKELKIPLDQATEGTAAGAEFDSLREVSALKGKTEAECLKNEKLLEKLHELSASELRQALPTAVPDAILNTLMQDLNSTRNQLATLEQDFGNQHPQVLRARKLEAQLDRDIELRINGILKGLEVRLAAQKALIENADRKLKDMQAGRAQRSQWDTYYTAKDELERLRKERDVAMVRAFQEHVESAMPHSGTNDLK